MDIASSTRDPAVRDAALTFVFVGGGYAGVEALGELEDMARYAARYYHNVTPEDMKWILVEASGRILPEVGEDLGRYTVTELRRRNIDVRLDTRLDSCADRVAVLSDGSRFPTRTVVWTAGVKPHPVLASTDLPLDDRGRLTCTAQLSVDGAPHAWAAGDAAAVPDVTASRTRPGVRPQRPARRPAGQGPRRQRHPCPARRAPRHVRPQVRRFGGLPRASTRAWPTSTAASSRDTPRGSCTAPYHLSRVPTVNRKARVLAEWAIAGLFKREIVSLGSLEHPRAEFELAAGGKPSQEPTAQPEGVVLTGRRNSCGGLGRLTDVGRPGTLPHWSTTRAGGRSPRCGPRGPGRPVRPGPRPPTTTRGKDS
ncbi:NAD(P)/FAD-dependent oxidoreductase OS=Streptomyces tendae OX=1932 GN=GUR47_22245 PE=3 SV=1 [Streptomyces tendae]